MAEDLYFKLGERLNENPYKWPLNDLFLDVLREYYTEEQATFAAAFPIGQHSAPSLSRHYDREEGDVLASLNAMADLGMIFTSRTRDGGVEYSLTPFLPGVFEFQLMRGTDTPEDRRKAKIVTELMTRMKAQAAEMAKNPEMLKKVRRAPAARTVTVEQELPPNSEVLPFENLSALVDTADSFAASVCYCRHHAYLVDNPCKVDNVPQHSCLSFNAVADFVVERDFGRRITKEECKSILEATEKAGLIHNANNFTGALIFVCNCCGCCCEFLKMIKEAGHTGALAYSNFGLEIDEASCTGCGDCLERCSMRALSLVDEIIRVDSNLCVGCANCVSACPSETLSMVRRANVVPPEGGTTMGGLAS